MVLRVDVKQAKPGMTLALPVRHPSNRRQILLHANFQLSSDLIQRLTDLGIRDIMVRYPGLEALDRFVNPEILSRRSEMLQNVDATFRKIQHDASVAIPYEQYIAQVGELVDKILSNPASLLFMDEAGDCAPGLLQHATAVSYLSLLIAMKIDGYIMKQRRSLPPRHARALGNLGIGAMLHDVGMLKIEPHVLERFEQTGNTDDPAWRAHTRIGYEIVRGQLEPTAAVIVLDHHQRFDGSGFPARRGVQGEPTALSGERIHIFARIVAAADTFHDLRFAAKDQPAAPAVRVLRKMITEPMSRWFDPQVLRGLLLVVPPYPPMSPVQLSDGRWAVPLEYNPLHPCRPRVQILPHFLATGTDLPNELDDAQQVDLAQSDLFVAKSEGHDVSKDNFDAPTFERTTTTSEVSICS
jgi:HD-GYP domain-containing protein (c-di-GMP phosphodiesterase class II)